MAKTAALFFFVFGILAVLGAIAQTGTSAFSREHCA